jgi:molybdopterin-guanine dinucleotide biosynthesis protein A
VILGAILAGGAARRFGSDKAMALLHDRPMIDHVAERLHRLTAHVVVCGRSHGDLPELSDGNHAGQGPLAGIAAALNHARDNGFDAVLTAPCDTPTVSHDLLDALIADGGPAYVRDCPVIGIWPAMLAPAIERFLEGPDRSVRGWAAGIAARPIDLPAPPNVNRPDDLALLR